MKFLSLGKWTQQGLSGLANWSGAKALRKVMKKTDVELLAFYWAPLGGRFDTVTLSEAEDLKQIEACKAEMLKLSATNTETYLIEPCFDEPLSSEMPLFLSLGRWTDKGMQNLDNPNRLDELKKAMLSHPVSLRSVNWVVCGGAFDVATLSQAESMARIARCHAAMLVEGRIRTEIHPLFTEDQLIGASRGLR